MYNCKCIRCDSSFLGKYPKTKICKGCSLRGQPRGESHWNYKDGDYTYETIRTEIRETHRYCGVCSKDLRTATRWKWVIHHKDHNHFNNDIDNLQLLCKSCHAKEHEVNSNFEGATTIPKGSRAK